MKKVFVDTFGWLALLLSSDYHHENALKTYLESIAPGHGLVTHDGVLLETGNALY